VNNPELKEAGMKRYVFGLTVLIVGLLFCFNALVVCAQEASVAEGVAIGAAHLRFAREVQRNNEAWLFSIPGVIGVGIGLDERGEELALHVHLNRHAHRASAAEVPQHVDGVVVRAMETSEIIAYDAGPQHRLRYNTPVPMGVSTSNDNGCYAGTLGVRVYRIGNSSRVGYITNAHVASLGGASLCPGRAVFSEDQFQPGLLDTVPECSATGAKKIGDLIQHIPIVFGQNFENTVDAAFVLSSRSLVSKSILDIGNPSPTVLEPALGAPVQKSGRTTGKQFGTITSINMTILVNYGAGCGVAKFINQIGITPGTFSDPGDSGSLILHRTTKDSSGRFRPIGLLFAGSDTTTFANRIDDVLGALSSVIDTL
jgi:hypothetical protein